MATMQEIEKKTQRYADARGILAAQVMALNDEIAQVKKKYHKTVTGQVAATRQAREQLVAALKEAPGLFESPRTVLLHGVKVGYEKGKGSVQIGDLPKFLKRVREHLKGKFDLLVKTTYKPIKKAIANLPAEDLKKLGVEVIGTTDEVVITVPKTDLDKLVDALLKEDGEEDEE